MEQCRKLVSAHKFNNEPLRIMLAATDEFIAATFQKHRTLLQVMKADGERFRQFSLARRRRATRESGEDAMEVDPDIVQHTLDLLATAG